MLTRPPFWSNTQIVCVNRLHVTHAQVRIPGMSAIAVLMQNLPCCRLCTRFSTCMSTTLSLWVQILTKMHN